MSPQPSGYAGSPPAADLLRYLQQSRDAMIRALDGLGEYDLRRPMTPTGTNLIGLVKHLAGIEFGYLGTCVGRPGPVLPWEADGSIWEGADMWASADEASADLVALYRRAWAHADASVDALGVEAAATVAWWPAEWQATTLGHLLVRVVAETAQHAGHAEILRELIDGSAGRDHEAMGDAAHWAAYVARIQAAADTHRTD